MSDNHTRENVYTAERISHVLSGIRSVIPTKPPTTVENKEAALFAALEVWGKSKVIEMMDDGAPDGYLDSQKKAIAVNEVSRLLGKLTWRDHVTERLMFAFSAAAAEILRERLVGLVALIVQWIIEIDYRIEMKRGGRN